MKSKKMVCVRAQLLSPADSLQLHDCSPPGSSVHGIFQKKYWSKLPFPPPRDLPNPGMKPPSPAFHVDSLLLSHLGTQDKLICKAETEIQT